MALVPELPKLGGECAVEQGLLVTEDPSPTPSLEASATRFGVATIGRRNLAILVTGVGCTVFAGAAVFASRFSRPALSAPMDANAKFDYNVQMCTADTVQVGCLEDDAVDNDCCAMPGHGSCFGSTAVVHGKPCAPGGAVATCCPKPQMPVAGDKEFFCWMVACSTSYEAGLVREHYAKRQNIFACEAASVYSDGNIDPVPVMNIGSTKSRFIHQGTWNSYVNTAVFLKAWHAVFSEGKWAVHGWTVKADPDTAWFPYRLRWVLNGLNCRNPLNVRNTGKFMLGPLEVYSAGAVEKLAELSKEVCKWGIDCTGEDGFLNECMKRLQIPQKYEGGLLATINSAGECHNGGMVAFHPLKNPGAMAACIGAASR